MPQEYRWLVDLVDIGAIAFLVYRALLLLRGALPLRLIYFLAALFALDLLSRSAGLEALRWLLDNFTSFLIIIIVIIFQHDIRRALVTSSRKRNSGDAQSGKEHVELVEEVVAAADSLAGKNIGALIVFEREMPLDNFMAVGTEIDAKVTSELLSSIFLPYSPIHDGAVIIQKGKLTKAGCFLPLTQNPDIDKALGTRHRAAIGLTEVVDAVVIIVSEETGRVALAIGGKIVWDLDSAALRKQLRKVLDERWLK